MNVQEHREFKAIIVIFEEVFQRAAAEREKRPGYKYCCGNIEPEWVICERKKMFETVNTLRIKRGLEPICIGDVIRVERMAVGHSDYAHKFSLYCAELVFDMNVKL